jgi:hypothetical protein
MLVDDRLHLRHHLIVRDAGLLGVHRLLDPGAEPCVIGLGLFGRRKFGLDGRELGHGGNIAWRAWWGKARAVDCVRIGDSQTSGVI